MGSNAFSPLFLLLLGGVLDLALLRPSRRRLRAREEELRCSLAALCVSEEKHRTAFEEAPVGMCEIAPDGRFLRVNRRLCEILGRPAAELLEMGTFEPLLSGERRFLRPDGSTVRCSGQAVPLRDPSGAVTGFLATLEDVTARRGAEEAARETEAALRRESCLFERMVDQAPALVWRSDGEGRCTFLNRTWLDFTGLPLDEALAGRWLEAFHEDDLAATREKWQDALRERRAWETEFRFRHRDGGFRWLAEKGVPLEDGEGAFAGLLGCCFDVTPLKEASERLSAAVQSHSAQSALLVSVQEEERRFLARELHDGFGQTLTALTYGLRRSAQRSRAELPEVAEDLLQLSRDVETAILDVRDLSRRLRPASLELGVVAAIESEVAMFRRKTSIQCVLEAPTGALPVDLERSLVLFRVAQEALANVARHAHATEVSVRLSHQSGRVRLVIADNGDGFPTGTASLGLTGLAERLSPFGGWLRLERNEPRGARLVASITVSPPGTPSSRDSSEG